MDLLGATVLLLSFFSAIAMPRPARGTDKCRQYWHTMVSLCLESVLRDLVCSESFYSSCVDKGCCVRVDDKVMHIFSVSLPSDSPPRAKRSVSTPVQSYCTRGADNSITWNMDVKSVVNPQKVRNAMVKVTLLRSHFDRCQNEPDVNDEHHGVIVVVTEVPADCHVYPQGIPIELSRPFYRTTRIEFFNLAQLSFCRLNISSKLQFGVAANLVECHDGRYLTPLRIEVTTTKSNQRRLVDSYTYPPPTTETITECPRQTINYTPYPQLCEVETHVRL